MTLTPAECKRRREALGWGKRQLAHEARIGFLVSHFEAGRMGLSDFQRGRLAEALARGEAGRAERAVRPPGIRHKPLSQARRGPRAL